MVDARLPAEWLGSIRIDNLSDRAFRVLAGALMWCNGQGTDGAVPDRYTKYLHPDGDDPSAFDELERAGLWERTPERFQLKGWSIDLRQSTAEEVSRYREAARRRQKAYRDRQRRTPFVEPTDLSETRSPTGDVTRDGTRHVTADVGSGSLIDSPKERAYERHNVTHNADSPYCPMHPVGTPLPCGACARARTAFEAQQQGARRRGWDCSIDGHKLVADGSCAVCSLRPRRSA